jgi:hypothetical protein
MTHRPVGAGSSFIFTAGTATTSSAFSVQSSVLRIVAVGGAAHVKIDGDPIATTSDYYVPSGESVSLALTKASNRVVGVTTGTTTTITVPEGTQVPFGVGDYVTLSASGQSYYDFSHKQVLSVDTTSSYDGYHQTRMIVNHNSSGVVTAFSSKDASISISNKVSARGVGSGTLYYQQVQVTGQA